MAFSSASEPMQRVSAVLLAVVVALLALTTPIARAEDGAVAVQVPAGQTVCFYEDVAGVGVKLFLHYMVTSGGAMDIGCKITGPDLKVVWEAERESENRILFKSHMPGAYSFCFSNRMSTMTVKVVSVSVLVGDGLLAEGAQPERTEKDTLHRSIRRLQQGLREIEELQQLLHTREQAHRATTEVANTRVVLFCALEIISIMAMGVGSIFYLRKMFVTKRMV